MIQDKKNKYLNDLNQIKQWFQQWIENINKLNESNEELIIDAITKSINRMKKFMIANLSINLPQVQKKKTIQQRQGYIEQLRDFDALQIFYWDARQNIQNQQYIEQYQELKEKNRKKIEEMKQLIFAQPNPIEYTLPTGIFQGYFNIETKTLSGRLFCSEGTMLVDCFLINNEIQFQIGIIHGKLYLKDPIPQFQSLMQSLINSLERQYNSNIIDIDEYIEYLDISNTKMNTYKSLKKQFMQKIKEISIKMFHLKQPQLYFYQLGLFYGIKDDIKKVISGRIFVVNEIFLCDILVIDDQLEFQISIINDDILLEKDDNQLISSILQRVKDTLKPLKPENFY